MVRCWGETDSRKEGFRNLIPRASATVASTQSSQGSVWSLEPRWCPQCCQMRLYQRVPKPWAKYWLVSWIKKTNKKNVFIIQVDWAKAGNFPIHTLGLETHKCWVIFIVFVSNFSWWDISNTQRWKEDYNKPPPVSFNSWPILLHFYSSVHSCPLLLLPVRITLKQIPDILTVHRYFTMS